ncbi:centrosomal protein of 57 kDa isoform X2 [Bombina bombina]|uniref:centrosomal protein of 57 kDa isoform X2 n=1 Tax=Bombina bombina TaxID=8345 RepID=UPI00235AFC2A|nr:centrosomal protein of 57 kDa isoform X2 [Bombina bombina]
MAAAAYSLKQQYNHLTRSPKEYSKHDTPSASSYVMYPRGKPFINSEIQRSPEKPIFAYPESNSRAIFSALKNLQEKIHKLELERTNAEENIKRLSKETFEHKYHQGKQSLDKDSQKDNLPRQNKDLSSQLSAAESRCKLLEKQLEYMRKLMRNAESERTSVLEKQISLEADQSLEKLQFQAKLQKLDMLEQEYLKLTTMQVMAEKKIREIEYKLKEEEHQRKLMQEKAAQLQTSLETNRILLHSLTPPKKEIGANRKTPPLDKKPSHSHTQPHYRLCLDDVPFVAGKLMKQHNKAFCNERVISDQPLECCDRRETYVRWAPNTTSTNSYQELSDVLITLEDEFGQMSFDHQQLVKQMQEAHSDQLKYDLERELEFLVRKMEAKADQITKVRKHQTMLEKLVQSARIKKKVTLEVTAKDGKFLKEGKETATTRSNPKKAKPGENQRKSLQLLKDMQTIQTSLRKDDISWDY